MRVWIIQTAEPLHIDSDGLRPMRAMNLADALVSQGHEVTVWSSDFHHYTKQHRFGKNKVIKYADKLEYRLFRSMGYKNHKGITRLIDHIQMSISLLWMLRKIKAPDVALIGYPPIEVAWIAARWLKKNKVPFLLDVKDEWPHIILREVPTRLKRLAKFALTPYFLMMRSTFNCATGITSVTQEFLEWCLEITGRNQNEIDLVTPTTSPDLKFSEEELSAANVFWDTLGVLDLSRKRVYFVGTINHVYNFDPILFAAKNSDFQFVIAGDGPQRLALIENSKGLKNMIFPGWINAPQAHVLAKRSAVAIAPFHNRSDFDMNITNKFYDAMRLGKPMLTSTEGVSGKLLQREGIGLVYSNSSKESFYETLTFLFENDSELSNFSQRARKTYLDKFSYASVYNKLIEQLKLASKL
jgi:glycosyltransferase involved in cell wall biosynthesis